MLLLIFVPPTPTVCWISRRGGGRSSGLRRDGHRAKPLRLLGTTSLKLAFHQTGAQPLVGDVSMGIFRPVVPLKFRKDIFLHFVAHPGRLASCCIISSRFVWRGLSSNITAWTHECLACQRGKLHHHTHLAPQPIPIPQRRFSHLHVDLVGPLQ
jgi:hypothetical protein